MNADQTPPGENDLPRLFSEMRQINERQQAADDYERAFRNLADIAHPAILAEPRFCALLTEAVKRGQPLTQAELDKIFGGLSWDW